MRPVRQALERLMTQHEPFPSIVVNLSYDILLSNGGFQALVTWLAGAEALQRTPNIYRLVFDTDGLQPFSDDWPLIRQALLSRLYEPALMMEDEVLWQLFADCSGSELA